MRADRDRPMTEEHVIRDLTRKIVDDLLASSKRTLALLNDDPKAKEELCKRAALALIGLGAMVRMATTGGDFRQGIVLFMREMRHDALTHLNEMANDL